MPEASERPAEVNTLLQVEAEILPQDQEQYAWVDESVKQALPRLNAALDKLMAVGSVIIAVFSFATASLSINPDLLASARGLGGLCVLVSVVLSLIGQMPSVYDDHVVPNRIRTFRSKLYKKKLRLHWWAVVFLILGLAVFVVGMLVAPFVPVKQS